MPPVGKICGVRNESGQDCFAIAVLHLLAQTEMVHKMEASEHHAKCTTASCLVAHFLTDYTSPKKRLVSADMMTKHYESFGLTKNMLVDLEGHRWIFASPTPPEAE